VGDCAHRSRGPATVSRVVDLALAERGLRQRAVRSHRCASSYGHSAADAVCQLADGARSA
jgi:hypothetical protein